MPSASRVKTVLGHRPKLLVSGALLLLLTLFTNSVLRQNIECANFDTPLNGTMQVGSKTVNIERVDTETGRQEGLSNRPCIKDNQAMLFVYDKNDQANHCFWMKDMRFAIDIVWLDSSKRIVDIARDVQPQTYPNNFCPGRPTAYVLEVRANTARDLGLEVNATVSF